GDLAGGGAGVGRDLGGECDHFAVRGRGRRCQQRGLGRGQRGARVEHHADLGRGLSDDEVRRTVLVEIARREVLAPAEDRAGAEGGRRRNRGERAIAVPAVYGDERQRTEQV